jgi:hypothetical protein
MCLGSKVGKYSSNLKNRHGERNCGDREENNIRIKCDVQAATPSSSLPLQQVISNPHHCRGNFRETVTTTALFQTLKNCTFLVYCN